MILSSIGDRIGNIIHSRLAQFVQNQNTPRENHVEDSKSEDEEDDIYEV